MNFEPLTGKALAATDLDSSIVALEGSVRSGKTFASLLDWLDQCVRKGPDGDLVMCGKTERTIVQNLIYPLQGWLGDKRVRLNRGTGTAYILGRRVLLVGGNNEGAVTRIQGPTFAGAYLDEASTVPENFFNMLYSRLSVPGARLWLTSNPETPAHWLKTEWLDRARLWIDREGKAVKDPKGIDLARISFKLEDNPNLDPDYVERIKAAYTGLWYRRYILGEWCIAAGAVYDEWDPARHVLAPEEIAKLAIAQVISLGIDYGTTNPTAGILVGITAERPARLVVLDEWAPDRAADVGLSKQLRRWLEAHSYGPKWVCVDPSAAGFMLQLHNDGFCNPTGAVNAVRDGIRLVASLLAADRLVVSSSCKHLIEELPGYCWDPKATAKGEDAPIKANDHFCDALRYGIATTHSLWWSQVKLTIPSAD